MLGAVDVPGVPLILLANVEEVEFGTLLADVLGQHRAILAHGGDMDLNAMRERLERDRADLASTIERIKERLAVSQRDSGGDIALADQHPADVASETVIFPLGPALFLSWANCDATVGRDQTKVYRCELKPEYQFPGTSPEQQ